MYMYMSLYVYTCTCVGAYVSLHVDVHVYAYVCIYIRICICICICTCICTCMHTCKGTVPWHGQLSCVSPFSTTCQADCFQPGSSCVSRLHTERVLECSAHLCIRRFGPPTPCSQSNHCAQHFAPKLLPLGEKFAFGTPGFNRVAGDLTSGCLENDIFLWGERRSRGPVPSPLSQPTASSVLSGDAEAHSTRLPSSRVRRSISGGCNRSITWNSCTAWRRRYTLMLRGLHCHALGMPHAWSAESCPPRPCCGVVAAIFRRRSPEISIQQVASLSQR